METSSGTIIPTSSTNPAKEAGTGDRRQRWFEVCLVLLVAFGGNIVSSLHLLIAGPAALPPMSNFRWAGGMLQQIAALLLLGYVLSRRGLKFANLGLRWSLRDVAVGLLVFIVSFGTYELGRTLIQTFHLLAFGTWPTGPTAKDFFGHPSVMAIPFTMLNPFFEELIVRAYLITEVTELTGSSTLAVAASVLVQFSYHLYCGWAGAITLSFFFMALALYYAHTRRATPVIVAHGFLDFYALIRLW